MAKYTGAVTEALKTASAVVARTAWGTVPTVERIAGYNRRGEAQEAMIREIDSDTLRKVMTELRNNYVCLVEGIAKDEISRGRFDDAIEAQGSLCQLLGVKMPDWAVA
jgi:hypothetical protein